MRKQSELLLFALITAAVACRGNTPLPSSAGVTTSAGQAGGPGTGGFTGEAGAIATGLAGAGGTAEAGAGATGQAGSLGDVCGSPTLASGQCASGAFPHAGICQCQDGTPCVCDGNCVNLASDDANCGACGHACPATSTCNRGTCGPVVVNALPARTGCGSLDIAVGGGRIVWADEGHGQVQSIALAGGAITTIASGESAPKSVALNAAGIYWINEGTNTIRRSLSGGAATPVITSMLPIHGFVVSSDNAFVYFSSDTIVSRVSATGGTLVVVAREEKGGIPSALALDGSTLAYPTDLNGDVDVVTLVNGTVASCGKESPDGSGDLLQVNCLRVGRSQGQPLLETILLTAGEVVWANGVNLQRSVLAKAASGGPFDIVVMTDQNTISGLAMTGSTIYFSDAGSAGATPDGVIYKVSDLPDQVPLRLARQQSAPRSVALSSAKVYWSTASCTIESTGL
jgi:hypothetical protein